MDCTDAVREQDFFQELVIFRLRNDTAKVIVEVLSSSQPTEFLIFSAKRILHKFSGSESIPNAAWAQYSTTPYHTVKLFRGIYAHLIKVKRSRNDPSTLVHLQQSDKLCKKNHS